MKRFAQSLGHGVEFGCILVAIIGTMFYYDSDWTVIWLTVALILSAYLFFSQTEEN